MSQASRRDRFLPQNDAAAFKDEGEVSVAAMLHQQLRVQKGGGPEEPIWSLAGNWA